MKNLNLVPKSYYLKKRQKRKRILNVVLVIITAVFSIFAVAFPFAIKNNNDKELNKLKIEHDTYLRYYATKKQLDVVNSMFEVRKSESEQIEQMIPTNKYSVVIERIERSKPEKLYIMNLSYNMGAEKEYDIGMSGTASSEIDIADFLFNLKTNKIFQNILLKNMSKSGENSFNFSINLQTYGG